MQAYDRIEGRIIRRLVKRFWADVIFPVSAPVPSSSLPAKEADPQLATMGPSGRGFGDFPYLGSGGRRFDFWKDQL